MFSSSRDKSSVADKQRGKKRIRLGDVLLARGVITQQQLEAALAEQKNSKEKLGRVLVRTQNVSEEAILVALSQQLNLPVADISPHSLNLEKAKQFPEALARRYRVILLKDSGSYCELGMSDPTDIFVLDDLSRSLGKSIRPSLIKESDLGDLLDVIYSRESEIANLAQEMNQEIGEDTFRLSDTNIGDDIDAPVVKLLQTLFEEALTTKASDIHLEPDEKVLRVRKRVDGVLVEQVMNEKRIAGALVVRLKVMAGLDISERRLPQDGRFHLTVKNKRVDVRLSTMPVQYGESVVLRLLNHSESIMKLDDIGMSLAMLAHFRSLTHKPYGLILVTGPTGSGKTSTLYSALAEMNTPDKKIITVEDPVEYRLPRLNQVQVNEKIDLSFAKILRASLRQDPDVLLVGEIRDKQSAEIALRAAMTGHLVLSTLHTNDAASAGIRLIDMGVDPFLVSSSLNAILAQRLLRKICDRCAHPVDVSTLDANESSLLELAKTLDIKKTYLQVGKGCAYCLNTGYRGRMGVYEMVDIGREQARCIKDNNLPALRASLKDNDLYEPLFYAALRLAMAGKTTLSEVMRVAAGLDE